MPSKRPSLRDRLQESSSRECLQRVSSRTSGSGNQTVHNSVSFCGRANKGRIGGDLIHRGPGEAKRCFVIFHRADADMWLEQKRCLLSLLPTLVVLRRYRLARIICLLDLSTCMIYSTCCGTYLFWCSPVLMLVCSNACQQCLRREFSFSP